MPECVIHWFRRDLRLEDNTALGAAMGSGSPVLPVFLLDDRILLQPTMGADRLRFLRTALRDLAARIEERGGRLLVLRTGDSPRELNRLAEETGAWSLYFNRDYTPYARLRDTRTTRGLQMTGVLTQSFPDQLLVEPYQTIDHDGNPAQSYEAFRSRWLPALDVHPAAPDPAAVFLAPDDMPESLPGWEGPWADEIATDSDWPGATARSAREVLARVADELGGYPEAGGSRLSAAIHFGTVSIRDVARAALRKAATDPPAEPGARAFLMALSRREYAYHLVFDRPELLRRGSRDAPDGEALRAWADGETGDADLDQAMRRLRREVLGIGLG